MEFNININVIANENGFSLWVSDDLGGSGIKVEGSTPKETSENLMPYIVDYLTCHGDSNNEDKE